MNKEPKPILDKEVLVTLQDAIGTDTQRIIRLYLDDFPRNIKEMRTALENHDFAIVGRLAHSLKSSSANLGAMQTSSIAEELEHKIKHGEISHEVLVVDVDKLAASYDQTAPMFNDYL